VVAAHQDDAARQLSAQIAQVLLGDQGDITQVQHQIVQLHALTPGGLRTGRASRSPLSI
jgi:hypothetical protein